MRSLVQFISFSTAKGQTIGGGGGGGGCRFLYLKSLLSNTHSHIFVKVLSLRNIKDAWLLEVAGLSLCLIPT